MALQSPFFGKRDADNHSTRPLQSSGPSGGITSATSAAPGSNAASARTSAQQALELLAVRAIPHASSSVAPCVSISVGLAQLDPETMDSFDQLLQRADQALYRAKSLGRNRITD